MLTNNGLAPTENRPTDRPIIARDKDLEEFRKSAIPDSLTLANVQFVEGSEAAKLFKPLDTTSKGFDLGRGKEQWRKWTHSDQGGAIVGGGWIAFGCNVDGTPGAVPLFKPNKPREDDSIPGKTKLVKYESPPKSEALPLLPIVDPETIADHYEHLDGQPFWPSIKRIGQPIAIVEGWKKALALTAHGLPAIAIRGITQWHQKGSKHLHPLIAQLLQPGQTVYIIFDQDDKATTRKAVRKQAVDLGTAIEAMDCVPLAVGWDEAIGKGIDDALYLKGLGAKNWLESMLEKAVPPIENLPAAEAKTANIDRLSAIVNNCSVWQTEDRIPMIDIPILNHKESISLKDSRFKNWLAYEFFERTGRHCSSDAIGQLTDRLLGQALSSPIHKVYHRVAKIGDEIYIDLGDQAHTIIKVCGAGWAIHEGECPAKFKRPNSMKALPVPSKNPDWSGLKEILNLRDEDWPLLMAWLSWGLFPNLAHPLLILNGEQGTGKSKTTQLLKRLIDPSKALLLSMPDDEGGLKAHASNRWLLAYDNLSGLSKRMSDAFCSVATGIGFSGRALYTDTDESLFDGVRPIVLNGIEDLVTRPDLLERSIILNLQPISDTARITEQEWEDILAESESNIFSALLDSLAQGLRRQSKTRPLSLSRMADFQLWGTCVESAFGFTPGEFERAYQVNRKLINETAIDNDAIATAILQMLETKNFVGTASDLLTELGKIVTEEQRKAPDWIKSPRVLGRRLQRLAPELRKRDIEITTGTRVAGARIIKLELVTKPPEIIPDSPPSEEEETIEFTAEYHEPTEPLEVGEEVVFVDSDDEDKPDREPECFKLLSIEGESCTIELRPSGQHCVSRLEWLKRRSDPPASA
jgi:Domain of unknown function (DUF3854)